MKFCPVVPEICHGQVHGARKERRIIRIRIIIIIIRNGAKTISLQTSNDFYCFPCQMMDKRQWPSLSTNYLKPVINGFK
jgi:hypothetical protein